MYNVETPKFRLFDVYLGGNRRKEDFFTYYLAACLEYCYQSDNEFFKKVLKELNFYELDGFDEDTEFKLLTGNELSKLFKESSIIKSYLCESTELESMRDNSKRVIFREFPLKHKGNNCYIDIVFAVEISGKVVFVLIEGKVFDSSVESKQLDKYYQAISYEFKKFESKSDCIAYVNLLSTIKEYKDKDVENAEVKNSKALEEVIRFNSEKNKHATPANFVSWSQFKELFDSFVKENDESEEGSYFAKSYHDAFSQIEINQEIDEKNFSEKKTRSYEQMGIEKYIGCKDHFAELDKMISEFKEKNEDAITFRYEEGKCKILNQTIDISKLEEEERGNLIQWILDLFYMFDNSSEVNVDQYDDGERINLSPKNKKLKEKLDEPIDKKIENLGLLKDDLDKIIKKDNFDDLPIDCKKDMEDLVKKIESQMNANEKKEHKKEHILMKEYINNKGSRNKENLKDNSVKEFYNKLFFENNLCDNKYIKFKTNSVEGVSGIGIWLNLKNPVKKVTGTSCIKEISLFTLGANGSIKQSKEK